MVAQRRFRKPLLPLWEALLAIKPGNRVQLQLWFLYFFFSPFPKCESLRRQVEPELE